MAFLYVLSDKTYLFELSIFKISISVKSEARLLEAGGYNKPIIIFYNRINEYPEIVFSKLKPFQIDEKVYQVPYATLLSIISEPFSNDFGWKVRFPLSIMRLECSKFCYDFFSQEVCQESLTEAFNMIKKEGIESLYIAVKHIYLNPNYPWNMNIVQHGNEFYACHAELTEESIVSGNYSGKWKIIDRELAIGIIIEFLLRRFMDMSMDSGDKTFKKIYKRYRQCKYNPRGKFPIEFLRNDIYKEFHKNQVTL